MADQGRPEAGNLGGRPVPERARKMRGPGRLPALPAPPQQLLQRLVLRLNGREEPHPVEMVRDGTLVVGVLEAGDGKAERLEDIAGHELSGRKGGKNGGGSGAVRQGAGRYIISPQ